MSKLKRCPCCKGEAKIIHNHDSFTDTYGAYIECQECGLRTKEIDTTLKFGQHIPSYNPIDFLITAWNTRKPMQNIVEQLENHIRYCELCHEEFNNSRMSLTYEAQLNSYKNAIEIVKEEGDRYG